MGGSNATLGVLWFIKYNINMIIFKIEEGIVTPVYLVELPFELNE